MRREWRLFTEGYREMKLKAVSGIMLTLLFLSTLTLAFNIQPVRASETIYIRADGSIEPLTANITSVDNVTYYFTDNNYDEIVVERNNIVVDGNGYTLQGTASGSGFRLGYVSNVTIQNTNIKNFTLGIYLYGSPNNTISGNNITNNDRRGILLVSFSSNNNISGNTVTANSEHGILLSESSNNFISGNTITANGYYGIRLSYSSNNTLRNNDASNNKYNFACTYPYIQDIDDSNTVDGKPVYYWVSRRDMTIPLDAGYVALVNCKNITVENLNLTNNGHGVLLCSTTNSTITKNTITKNEEDGIYLSGSSNNTISGNKITNNEDGIELYESSNYNIISGNNITENYDCGIYLSSSSNNSISGNNITENNWYGIRLWYSSNNTISGNTLINNGEAITLKESSNNTIYGNTILNDTNIQVSPSYITVPQNTLFNVSILIENMPPEDLGAVGVEFRLTWNSSVLNAVSMEEVLFSDVPPGEEDNIWKLAHVVDSDRVWYAYAYMDIDRAIAGGYAPKSGNGTLAIITFNSTALGETDLHFTVTKAGAFPVMPIPLTDIDGIVVVGDVALGDLNFDGTVDIFDIIILGGAFGSQPGDPNWNPNTDINQDDIVDIYDAIILAAHFGETI
jgi:parallel beta-helix repeat protein